MKKLVVLFLTAIAALALVACGTTTDPDHIVIAFVPSNNASAILARANELEELLEERIEGKTFEVIVGTDYDAVVEGMLAGSIQIGFLTGQQYAGVTTEYPGEVEVLLTSVREGFAAQYDNNGNLVSMEQLLANIQLPGYTGALVANSAVTFYHSILLVPADSDIESVADLAGKTVATSGTSSGSGYVYPAVLLDEYGLKFVSGTPNAAAGEVRATLTHNHNTAARAVYNGEVDAGFMFMDVRTAEVGTYADIFTATKVIALTPGIYNDTISAVSSLSSALKTAIADAFLDLITTVAGKDVMSVYSHTGYLKTTDADYDGERAVYAFKKENEL